VLSGQHFRQKALTYPEEGLICQKKLNVQHLKMFGALEGLTFLLDGTFLLPSQQKLIIFCFLKN
jgi:hypothetical protein